MVLDAVFVEADFEHDYNSIDFVADFELALIYLTRMDLAFVACQMEFYGNFSESKSPLAEGKVMVMAMADYDEFGSVLFAVDFGDVVAEALYDAVEVLGDVAAADFDDFVAEYFDDFVADYFDVVAEALGDVVEAVAFDAVADCEREFDYLIAVVADYFAFALVAAFFCSD